MKEELKYDPPRPGFLRRFAIKVNRDAEFPFKFIGPIDFPISISLTEREEVERFEQDILLTDDSSNYDIVLVPCEEEGGVHEALNRADSLIDNALRFPPENVRGCQLEGTLGAPNKNDCWGPAPLHVQKISEARNKALIPHSVLCQPTVVGCSVRGWERFWELPPYTPLSIEPNPPRSLQIQNIPSLLLPPAPPDVFFPAEKCRVRLACKLLGGYEDHTVISDSRTFNPLLLQWFLGIPPDCRPTNGLLAWALSYFSRPRVPE